MTGKCGASEELMRKLNTSSLSLSFILDNVCTRDIFLPSDLRSLNRGIEILISFALISSPLWVRTMHSSMVLLAFSFILDLQPQWKLKGSAMPPLMNKNLVRPFYAIALHTPAFYQISKRGPATSNWHSIKGGNYKEKYISCAISTNVNFKFAVNTNRFWLMV